MAYSEGNVYLVLEELHLKTDSDVWSFFSAGLRAKGELQEEKG